MSELVFVLITGTTTGIIIALLASGLVLIFRATQVLNFAHGQFMMIAAYGSAAWLSMGFLGDWLAVPIGIVLVAVLGWVAHYTVFQKMAGLPHFMPVIATFGFAAAADGVMRILFGSKQYVLDLEWLPTATVKLLGTSLNARTLVIAAAGLLAFMGCIFLVRHTRFGRQLRAAGQDPLLASHGGISIHRIYAASWALGAGLAGLAGIGFGAMNIVSPSIVETAFLGFPAMLLGGLDSLTGALVGGVAVGILGAGIASYLSGDAVTMGTYVLLLGVVLFLPNGLFGTETVEKL